jgi:hypothetical protein
MSTSYTAVNLGSGQTYKVNSSNQRITGSDGTETVVIAAGVWNTVITAAVERVTLGVNLFDTRAYVSNGQIVIAVLGKGTELTINPAANGTQLNFADGGVPEPTSILSAPAPPVMMSLNGCYCYFCYKNGEGSPSTKDAARRPTPQDIGA